MKSYNHILTVKQVQQLRAACDIDTPKGKRDLAILDTMLFQGLRLKEVANLRLEDFRCVGNQLEFQLKNTAAWVKIHKTLRQSLQSWINQMNLSFGAATGPIFVPISISGRDPHKSLSRQTISHLVAKYGYQAGLTPLKGLDRLKPGDLRRTCARNAYENGANLLSLQVFLGFNHLETVARYIGVLNVDNLNSVRDQISYEE
jgi:site-specific recombinase XerD